MKKVEKEKINDGNNEKTNSKRESKVKSFLLNLTHIRPKSFTVPCHSIVTENVMAIDLMLVMLPIVLFASYSYGVRALLISVISLASYVIFELWADLVIYKSPKKANALIFPAGLSVSLLLSPCVPYWIPVFISFVSVILGKAMKLADKPIFNPVLLGYSAAVLLFGKSMSVFAFPFTNLPVTAVSIKPDALETANTVFPLASLLDEGQSTLSVLNIVIGMRSGVIGELSVIFLVGALLYLLIRRVITWHIPLAFLLSFGTLGWFFSEYPLGSMYIAYQIFDLMTLPMLIFFISGFGASPVSKGGKLIYGVCCGVLTFIFRRLGFGYSAIVYATLISGVFSIPLDIYMKHDFFGDIFLSDKKKAEIKAKRKQIKSAISDIAE